MNTDEIKKEFDANVFSYAGSIIIDRGMQGAIIGTLEKACGGRAENRHAVIKFLTGKTSSKQLTPSEWFGFYHLVLPFKPEGGKWGSQRGEADLEKICNILLGLDGLTYPELSPEKDAEFERSWIDAFGATDDYEQDF